MFVEGKTPSKHSVRSAIFNQFIKEKIIRVFLNHILKKVFEIKFNFNINIKW